jgi:aryl-alcohol dehydrogenase-like predicted oxidoreductase
LGVNFFDTADVYGERGRSEELLGQALAGVRERVVIATKFRSPMAEGDPNAQGASRHHIYEAVAASLRRLRTDHIDLYQLHSWDAETPVEETLRALDDLVRAGLVRYIGASNVTAWQLAHSNAVAQGRGWQAFVSVQPHYHLLHRPEVEREIGPYCQWAGVGILPYFPLAGGFLTGKYRRGQPPPPGTRGERSPYVQRYLTESNFAVLEKLEAFAQARGHTVAELAIAWLLAQPQVSSVIAGVTRPDQLAANAKAAGWPLAAEEAAEVRQLLDG